MGTNAKMAGLVIGLILVILSVGQANAIILTYDSPAGMTIETDGIIRLDSGLQGGGRDKSFHAPSDGRLQVWRTASGERVGSNIINERVKKSFTYRWTEYGEQDREIIFRPDTKRTTTQKEAFFESGVMQDWDIFWSTQSPDFRSVWPFLIDVDGIFDLHVGVDLTAWHASPVAFTFGEIIPILGGKSSLLPGFIISTSEISYLEGQGWVTDTAQLFSGQVQLAASNSVPEPSVIVLFGIGLAVMGLARRRMTA